MRILHAFQRIIFPIIQINVFKVLFLYKRNADFHVASSFLTNKKFSSEAFIWELGYIKELIRLGINFSYGNLFTKSKKKYCFWSPSSDYAPINCLDYPDYLKSLVKRLELKGVILSPSSNETEWLENKFFMYQRFDELNISHPKTWLFDSKLSINWTTLEFPLLFKGNHSSASMDIHKFNSIKQLETYLENVAESEKIILQKLVNMRKDMRVTFVGKSIHSSFWRINTKNEWMVTASSNGSLIRFERVPQKWVSYLHEVHEKCGLATCGMDVCFEMDDEESMPLILEVSPRFSLNPYYDVSKKDFEYKAYKKKVFIRDSYRFLQTKEIMLVAGRQVEYVLNSI